jgi:hypothetical protein
MSQEGRAWLLFTLVSVFNLNFYFCPGGWRETDRVCPIGSDFHVRSVLPLSR